MGASPPEVEAVPERRNLALVVLVREIKNGSLIEIQAVNKDNPKPVSMGMLVSHSAWGDPSWVEDVLQEAQDALTEAVFGP